jgi:plasmid maintenance system antidote protein VapI
MARKTKLRRWADLKGRGAIAELARATGLHYVTVWHAVHGTRETSPTTAKALAKATGIDPAEILGLRK